MYNYMVRAIELAGMGTGNTAPNPMVGCVVVHGNKIVGEGYHKVYGGPHAEVNAIESVADKSVLPRSVLYVSLEPCNHFGKTPPCTDLIIRSGIKKVVVGCADPFGKVNGSGIKKLEGNGVEVTRDVMADECREINKRFFTFHLLKRPYIILKYAQSADGFLAPLHQDESNRWISNVYSQKLVHKWRSEEMGILVGANTAVADNPKLNVRHWQGKDPLRILIDKGLKTPLTSHLLSDGGRTLVFTGREVKHKGIEFCEIDFNSNVLHQVMKVLYEKNIQSVIVEGGAATLNKFINENLWDEARIFTSGDKVLREGVPAPLIPSEPVSQQDILQDKLLTYRNKNI